LFVWKIEGRLGMSEWMYIIDVLMHAWVNEWIKEWMNDWINYSLIHSFIHRNFHSLIYLFIHWNLVIHSCKEHTHAKERDAWNI